MFQNKIKVLQNGYCHAESKNSFVADCTVTLIESEIGPILVDTSGPWNRSVLIDLIKDAGHNIEDIDIIICTHGHSDHVGNLNLFPEAKFIVGYDIFRKNKFESFDFNTDTALYKLCDTIDVIPTPGHMHSDVSVVVRDTDLGTVVIAGDLFENGNDHETEDWKSLSENVEMQTKNRQKVLSIADYIVPGHGEMFKATPI